MPLTVLEETLDLAAVKCQQPPLAYHYQRAFKIPTSATYSDPTEDLLSPCAKGQDGSASQNVAEIRTSKDNQLWFKKDILALERVKDLCTISKKLN